MSEQYKTYTKDFKKMGADLSDRLELYAKKIADKEQNMLEIYAKAFIGEVGLNPSECELVIQRDVPVASQSNDVTTFETRMFFRKREESDEKHV